MLYEKYQRKIITLSQILKILWRFKILIASIALTILAITAVLMAVHGIVYDVVSCPKQIYYGEKFDYKAKAFMDSINYEYSFVDSDNWTKEKPYSVGTYKVRGVSKRVFGIPSYGTEYTFTIMPKNVDVYVAETKIVYGDTPSVIADLSYGDSVTCNDYVYDEIESEKTKVEPLKESIVITNKDGTDVTFCYNLNTVKSEITIGKRFITVTVDDEEIYYDGLAHAKAGFSITEGALANSHSITATFNEEIINAGEIEVCPDFTITSENGIDVTSKYEITIIPGTLRVLKRPINISTGSAEKVYDDIALSSLEYSLKEDNELLKGHTIEILNSSSITNVGDCENIIEYAIFNGKEDVTENYDIICQNGRLSILTRSITIQTPNNEWIYDGLGHYDNEISVTSNINVVDGHQFEVIANATAISVGKFENKIELAIKNKEGLDVTSNYSLTYENGLLTIFARPITIQTGSNEWMYDGNEHTENATEVISERLLAEGHSIQVIKNTSINRVGILENVLDVVIYSEDNFDVTSNYSITYQNGSISIIPRPITIKAKDVERIYDGTVLTSELCEIVSEIKVVEWHEYTAKTEGYIINVGEVVNKIVIGSVIIYDGEEDVTQNYEISYQTGILSVIPRPIVVQTGSNEWMYDDLLHYDETANISKLSEYDLVLDHEIVVISHTEVINVCEVENILEINIITAEDINVTENYAISYEYGTLNITPRPITIKAGDATKIYDGTALTCELYEIVSEIKLVEWHEYTAKTEGSIINVGEVENKIAEVAIYSGEEDVTKNYEIDLRVGILTIIPRPIVIKTGSNEWMYDGMPHFDETANMSETSEYDLVPNHEIIVVSHTIVEDVCEVENILEVNIKTAEDINVTENYAISYENGTLTITPRPITIKAGDATKMYDDTALTCELSEITSEIKLVEWHEYFVETEGSIINVGEVENEIAEVAIYSGEKDVTENYALSYATGTLTITPRPITIKAGDATKTYDGTALTCELSEVVSEIKLVEWHELIAKTEGSIINAGIAENLLLPESVAIYSGEEEVTTNYEITIINGTLTINKAEIIAGLYFVNKVYDGTALHYEPDDYYIINCPEGITLNLQLVGTLIEVGSLDFNELLKSSIYSIKDSSGNDVSYNFDIKFIGTELTIEQRQIEITSISAKQQYDGTELKNDTAWLSKGSLVAGHQISITVKGAITDVGKVDNKITNVVITDKDGNDVTKNYKINTVDGTLEII